MFVLAFATEKRRWMLQIRDSKTNRSLKMSPCGVKLNVLFVKKYAIIFICKRARKAWFYKIL